MPFLTPLYPALLVILFATNVLAGMMWAIKSTDAKSFKAQLEMCQAKSQAFKDQVEAQGRLAAERARSIEDNHRRTADETSKGWAAALDVVRRDADRRLRLATNAGAGGRGVSAAGATASGIDAPTQVDLPPPARIIADCAEDALTLVWLQDWVFKTSRP